MKITLFYWSNPRYYSEYVVEILNTAWNCWLNVITRTKRTHKLEVFSDSEVLQGVGDIPVDTVYQYKFVN